MFSGLQAACMDLRYSADQFFDEQNLHDLKIQSTLGLTEEDLKAVAEIEGVESVVQEWSLEEETDLKDSTAILEYRSFSSDGIDVPYVVEGTLPSNASEAAVTRKTAADYELSIGDTLRILPEEEEESEDSKEWQPYLNVVETEFIVSAIVTDATDIDNPFGSVSYRTDSSKADTVFVLPEVFDGNYSTGMLIRAEEAKEDMCYTEAYEDRISAVKDKIEKEIKEEREAVREAQVVGKAQEELDQARMDADQELADAFDELIDAENELEEGREKGTKELEDAQAELDQSIIDGKKELEDSQETLDQKIAEGLQEIEDGEVQILDAYDQLDVSYAQFLSEKEAAEAEITAGQAELNLGLAQFSALPEEMKSASEEYQTLLKAQAELDAQKAAAEVSFAEAENEIEEAYVELDQQWEELILARETLEEERINAQQQIDEGLAELEKGRIEGQEKIDQGKIDLEQELTEAQEKIDEGWEEYWSGKEEADQEIADAQAEIDEMREAMWHIQDRGSISGYANVESDADSIEAIGTVFPIVFFIVAILISLTTITRMVEEDRSLIGTYKSLGFTDGEIRRKYLVYAGCAGIIGSAFGTFFAFIGLPAFIFLVFDIMYLLPGYTFHFIPLYGILGPAIFTLGILFASAIAVQNELKQVPASLMRPLAPKAGSRIFLERIRPIWQSFSFLQKVTARNLFRYKKRLFMTIFGIAGCTALMLFGFAIRDSVADLSPRQYEETFRFDLMAVADSDETDPMFSFLKESDQVSDSIKLSITSAELKNAAGKSTTVTTMVVPKGEEITGFVQLQNRENGDLQLRDNVIYVTRNAANVLGLKEGDSAELKLVDLQSAEIIITSLTENYLGNYLYMTDATYGKYFEDFEINAALAHLSGSDEEQIRFTDALKEEAGVLSVTGTAELESQFSGAFMLINMVVAIVILMSAALAFVVLFTLATTNISERARELATIKVLGFYDPEVHLYINRETMILTGIGIIIGMPLGRLFAESLTIILNLPSIYLAVSLKGRSYLYALLLNVIFALIVNWVIGRSMDQIDPVEALKSVE